MSLRRLISRSLLLLLGVLIVLFGVASVLILTNAGSRWIVELALNQSGGMASVRQFDGRLWDKFELFDINIDAAPGKANIEQLSVAWNLRELLTRTFNVSLVEIKGVELTLPAQSSGESATPIVALPVPPLNVVLQRLVLQGVTIHLPEQDVLINETALGATWDSTKLTVTGFDVAAYENSIALKGSMTVGERPQILARLDWLGELAGSPGEGAFEVSGPLSELRFETVLDAVISGRLNGTVASLNDQPRFSVHGSIDAPLSTEGITVGKTLLEINGTIANPVVSIATDITTPQTGAFNFVLDTSLTNDTATGDIMADVKWQAKPHEDKAEAFVGNGKIKYTNKVLQIEHATTAPYITRLTGDIGTISDDPMIDLVFAWTDIQYALSEKETLRALSGDIAVTGHTDKLSLITKGDFELPQVGAAKIRSVGHLSGKQFTLNQLTAVLLDGEMNAEGMVDWSKAMQGNFRFTGHNIDLSRPLPETPSRLKFAGSSEFHSVADGITAQIDLESISGYLRGHELLGKAKLHKTPGSILVKDAQLNVGSNRIDVDGIWGDRMDARFNLQVEDLSALDSRLTGKIFGNGNIAGQLPKPRIDAQLRGTNLKFDRISAPKLDAIINVDMTRDIESRVDFTIDSLIVDKKQFGTVTFAGRGRPSIHNLQLDIDGEALSLTASADGAWQDATWSGTVQKLHVNSDVSGSWTLAEPSDITLGTKASSLTKACLSSDGARACIAGEKKGNVTETHVIFSSLPLRLIDHYLPSTTIDLKGGADGEAELRIAQGVVTGTGYLGVEDGTVERHKNGGETEKLNIEKFKVDFDISPDAIKAQADASIQQWLTLRGSMTAARNLGGVVTADVSAKSSDISWVADFFPELSGSNGELELTATANGTLENPSGVAHLKLNSGALMLPDAGLEINLLEATVKGENRAVGVDVKFGASDRVLNLVGQLNLDEQDQWRYDFKLDGESFPLVRTPEAEADISPALRLEGDQKHLQVTGTLDVPYVAIDVKELPNAAVSVSEDQILVAEDGTIPTDAENDGFLTDRVSGAVSIRLGDNISVNGFGLKSSLSGKIDWAKKRGSALGRANGTVKVDEGFFKAYGQHMVIEDGRIQFIGPVDNPSLNLRAYRPDLPVKAGVAVSGTVAAPKISLFSEPSLSDGNTLSYIVTGRGLDDAGAGDAAVLTQAALSLGAEQSAVVTDQIRNTFGLDELSVAAGDTVQDTSLVASKRLSPKLSVRSGFNPFDQLWSFFLNYQLTPRWSIEAESGDRQGADLLYSIEQERLFDRAKPE